MLSFQGLRLCSRKLHQKLHISTRKRIWNRSIVTESIEPPIASVVPEKPCTLVLLEDQGLYQSSWNSWLSRSLPNEHGLHYCYQTITLSSLEAALSEITTDLATMPSVVLLARGPVVSWVAQYYLESLSLAGLILVDPMFEPSSELLKELKNLYSDASVQEHNMLNRIQSGQESRPLKLEPGVIPMLILSSIDLLKDFSQAFARRHSRPENPFGEVRTVSLPSMEDPSVLINNWVEQVVI
jgi:hypothetical protein